MVHTSKPILPLNSRFLTNWLIRQTTQCPLSKIFQFVHWFRLVHHCVLTNWPMTVQPFFKWKSPNFDHMQYKRKKSWPFIQNFSMIYWWCHVMALSNISVFQRKLQSRKCFTYRYTFLTMNAKPNAILETNGRMCTV